MIGRSGMLRHQRMVGIACALAATCLGIAYLMAAGAPASSSVVNGVAFLLGVVALAGIGGAMPQISRYSGPVLLVMGLSLLVTALLGASFVGMQAFEWSKLIHEGVRPWSNPWGAAQFGSSFFMITGFHGTHVSFGVLFLLIVARKVWRGDYEDGRRGFFTSRKGNYEAVEIMGLYWHFVDLVWVFIFAFFYLW